jgi:hypothetical protein
MPQMSAAQRAQKYERWQRAVAAAQAV